MSGRPTSRARIALLALITAGCGSEDAGARVVVGLTTDMAVGFDVRRVEKTTKVSGAVAGTESFAYGQGKLALPAEIEVSPEPHTGCRLFAERFGLDAQRFVGSERGSALSLRGINAWVVKGADVRVGDEVVALFD